MRSLAAVAEASSSSRTVARIAADGWVARLMVTASARARETKASSPASGLTAMKRRAPTPGQTVRLSAIFHYF